MLLRSLRDTLRASPGRSRRKSHSLVANRLALESLEDRLTPAAFLTMTDAVLVEGHDGMTNAVVRVNLTEPHGNSVTVNFNTVDGSATADSDFNAVSGKLTFTKNEMSKNILIPVRGDHLYEPDEWLSVRLSNAKGAKIADGTANVTINDDESLVSITGASVTEGNSGNKEMRFTVSLSSAYEETVTVDFTTANGSASAGSDFVAKNGTVTFVPDQPTSQEIIVVVNGDNLVEYDENFMVSLSNASSNAEIGNGVAYGTIYDDEPRVSITGWSADEGNSGKQEFRFTVSLSRAYDEIVTVEFYTADGTASDGSDYVATEGKLTFMPNQPTSQDIVVVVNGDQSVESNEYFSVNLKNASTNAQISNGVAYGNIYDDEPRIEISDTWYDYYSSYMMFTVTLYGSPLTESVTVDFTTMDGNAYAGFDYVFTEGTITFDPGETTEYIWVEVTNFSYMDAYFYVQLSNATPPVQITDDLAAGYWYYDYGYYDPGYYYYDYYYYW